MELIFADPDVARAYDGFAPALRAPLLALRAQIVSVAKTTPGVGQLIETLKWGEPAYLPARPRVGVTIRVGGVRGAPDRYALFVNCRSTLIDEFRALYRDEMHFVGQRAIEFPVAQRPPRAALRHCIALALTYHLRPRASTR